MTLPITVTFGSPPVSLPSTPDLSIYRQVKHDFEMKDVEGEKQRLQLPETVKTYDDHFVSLTSAWQWYWFRLLIHSWTSWQTWDEHDLNREQLAYMKSRWRSLTLGWRALTNHHGTDLYADYITSANLDMSPAAIETLSFGGNVLHILGEETKGGVVYQKIEMLDGTRYPPDIAVVNRLTRPDLIGVVTNVSSNPLVVDPFPQLDGADVVYPFVSKRPNWMRVVRLKAITTYPPKPYFP